MKLERVSDLLQSLVFFVCLALARVIAVPVNSAYPFVIVTDRIPYTESKCKYYSGLPIGKIITLLTNCPVGSSFINANLCIRALCF